MADFKDQVVYITGGTRGIGRALAERFLAEGAKVAVTGRNAANAAGLVEAFGATGRLLVIESDAKSLEGINSSIDETEISFGPLDICILNAGGVRESTVVVDMSDEEWQHELDLNLNHVFRGTRRALRTMIPREYGRIIAVSSIEGKHAKPRVAGYTANKHAINGFIKAVAREVGPLGIAASAICPGLVGTDMLYQSGGKNTGAGSVDAVIEMYTKEAAIKRMVTVGEVADLVALLAGPSGMAFAGGTISVDGGHAFY